LSFDEPPVVEYLIDKSDKFQKLSYSYITSSPIIIIIIFMMSHNLAKKETSQTGDPCYNFSEKNFKKIFSSREKGALLTHEKLHFLR
jgi:hypothetical protein